MMEVYVLTEDGSVIRSEPGSPINEMLEEILDELFGNAPSEIEKELPVSLHRKVAILNAGKGLEDYVPAEDAVAGYHICEPGAYSLADAVARYLRLRHQEQDGPI
jgi:hypothetical protein